MKTAIIIHGMPSKENYFNPQSPAQSNKHWLPWLQRQLILNDILAQTPEMPEAYRPDYEKWRSMFERFPVDEETTLIGHSAGGGFLLRWLSENKVHVGKVALVAPWINPKSEYPAPGFFDFTLDPDVVSRTAGMMMFVSNDDEGEVLATVENIKKEIKGVQVQEFTGRGHFTMGDMKTEEFPELAQFLLS